MKDDKRYILFAGDGPLNAVDGVIERLAWRIDENLREDEPAFLNNAAAYLRILIAVLRDVGGIHMVSERFTEWEEQAMRTYDTMKNSPEEIAADRPFLESLFHELGRLRDAESAN